MFVYKHMTQDGIRLVGYFLSDNFGFLIYAELLHKFNLSKSAFIGQNLCMQQDCFNVCFKIRSDITVPWIRYRTLHRVNVLPVNYQFSKIQVIADDRCTF